MAQMPAKASGDVQNIRIAEGLGNLPKKIKIEDGEDMEDREDDFIMLSATIHQESNNLFLTF